MQRKYDYNFKVILIGSTSVGKTALLKRFADNQFNQTYLSTIGIDFRFKSFYQDDKFIRLQIWDTAGQQRFRNITKSYYNGSNAILIVYDVNNQKSFLDVKQTWAKDALSFCDAKKIFILGNKCDDTFKDYIKKEDLQWAKKNDMEIIGVSAKTGNNVEAFFEQMTRKLMKMYPQQEAEVMKLGLEENSQFKKKKCEC